MKVVLNPLFLCHHVLGHILPLALDALYNVQEAVHLLRAWISDPAHSTGLMTKRFSPLCAFVPLATFWKGHELLTVVAQKVAHVGDALSVISGNVIIYMASIFV